MSYGSMIKTLVNLATSWPYGVDGDSMSPTLVGGQYLLAKHYRFAPKRLSRGDIVMFRPPRHTHQVWIKRIVGLPDESISINEGVTLINDSPIAEPYLIGNQSHKIEPKHEWWNGPEEYFVMGDNRNDSEDSRKFGPIHKELIFGRVWFRCWPPGDWGHI
jgi:signal peptidase I